MGYIRHELVIFTVALYLEPDKTRAAVEALRVEMPEEWRHLIVNIRTPVNGYEFWAMFPDGSKEGWESSDRGDVWRERFKSLAPYGDPVQVAWGDDPAEIVMDGTDADVKGNNAK